jgi:hypothetical protein
MENNIKINVKERAHVVTRFSLHVEYVIFNVVSMLCLISILNNSDRIIDKTIKVARKYIENKCEFKYPETKASSVVQKGGRLGSATFLGATEAMYSATNPTNDILPVDFQSGVARPQIGGKSSNNKILRQIVMSYINNIMSHHNVKASKEIKEEIFEIAKFHVDCLINCIKSKKSVSVSTIKECVNKHKVLRALK